MTSADATKLRPGDVVRVTVLGVSSRFGPIRMLTEGRVDAVEIDMPNGNDLIVHVRVYFGSFHGIVRLPCNKLDRK